MPLPTTTTSAELRAIAVDLRLTCSVWRDAPVTVPRRYPVMAPCAADPTSLAYLPSTPVV